MLKALTLFFLCTCLFCKAESAQYFSETKQDEYIHKAFFQEKHNGIFIDIGAHAGIKFSNTYFFEKNLNWTGICFEPNPKTFSMLTKNRQCTCLQKGVSDVEGAFIFIPHDKCSLVSGFLDKYNPTHYSKKEIESQLDNAIMVETILLNSALEQYGIEKVDLLSIDTEGGELEILKSIDFNRFDIQVIVVENIYYDPEFRTFLESKGYEYQTRLHRDEVFAKLK